MTNVDKLIFGAALLIVGATIGRGVMRRFLYPHLKPDKFQGYWEKMDEHFLMMLNTLFEEVRRIGLDAEISEAPGATGRDYGSENSQHYAEGRRITAADVMFWAPMADGTRRRLDDAEFRAVYGLIRELGFTGIGAAPDWQPYSGYHVDTRENRSRDFPAEWAELKDSSGVQTVNNPIEKAFA